ncbi:MAG TPA: hypothetical protein VIY72_17650, partial [Acidimicrobiales bacterium]
MTAPEDPQPEPTAPVGVTGTGAGTPKRRKKKQGRLARRFGPRTAGAIEWAVVIGGAILLAVIVKVFLV